MSNRNIPKLKMIFKLRLKLMVAAALLCCSLPGFAQQTVSQLRGVIKNVENSPVRFATIILLDQDSVYVMGDLSKEDGTFAFASIKPATYRIRVQHLEYKPYLSGYFVISSNEDKVLPHIQLSESVTQLSEVVITGTKEVIEVHADKLVFNVASSPNASGNNGLELLAKTPGVLVDPDNNIILQGKSGVRIFINGRPSRLSGSDLTAMLQSTQADNIESIEVITNPSARYDAEGTAGIINIKLKKNSDYGYNGTLLSNYSKGDYSRMSNGLTLNYRKGKVNLYGDVTRFDNDFQSDFVDIKEQSGYHLDQVSLGLDHSEGFNFSAGADFAFNAKHSIALTGRGIIIDGVNTLSSETDISDLATSTLNSTLMAKSIADPDSRNLNYSLNYQYMPAKTSTVSVDLSLGEFLTNQETYQPNQYISPGEPATISEVNNKFTADTQIDLWSAQLDFEQKYKKIKISTGAKYSYINTDNSFVFYTFENNQPVRDPNNSNDFTYIEKVSALYAIASINFTAKINLNAGLRVEHTSSEGRLKSEVAVSDNTVIRNYTDYFPNVSLSYNTKKKTVWSVSIGRRVTRPNYQDLNPFESKLSELVIFKGNPFLKPNYVMNYTGSYAHKQKLIISDTYSVTHDFFATILHIVDTTGTVLIPGNMQRATNNSLTISYPITLTKWWEVTSFANYNYSSFKGKLENTTIDLEANIYNFRIQNNIALPRKTILEVTYAYSSPQIWRGSILIDAISGLNFGLRKNFFNDRLQVRITGSDVFNRSSDRNYHGNYGGLKIDGIRSIDNRRYGAGLTFKFGNQKVKAGEKRKTALDSELNRISN